MGGGDDNHNTGLTNFQPSQAMRHGYISYPTIPDRFSRQARHLGHCHCFVRFINEIQSSPAERVVPNDSFKRCHRTIGRFFNFIGDFLNIDRSLDQATVAGSIG